MFSGDHDSVKGAEINKIFNSDLIFPGEIITISQKRPVTTFYKYLESVYAGDFRTAYASLFSMTASWFSYKDFINSLDSKTQYELSSI